MIISNGTDLRDMIGSLRRSNFLYFDVESCGFDPYSRPLIMLQFWDGEGEVYIVDCRSIKALKRLGEMLAPLFAKAVVIGHNLKFDLSFARVQLGLSINHIQLWDTMIAEQYLKGLGLSDAMKQNISFSLKETAKRHEAGEMSKEERNWFIDLDTRVETRQMQGILKYEYTEDDGEWGMEHPDEERVVKLTPSPVMEEFRPWDEPFPPEQIEYAERDVRVLKPIYESQRRVIEARGMLPALEDEAGALLGLVLCETNGIHINVEAWRSFIAEKAIEAEGLYNQVYDTFAPAILDARIKKFDEEMVHYCAWATLRDGYLDLLRRWWDNQAPEVEGFDSWGQCKNSCMRAWKDKYPNPGKPKLVSEPPNLGSPTQLLDALHAKGIMVDSAGVEVLEPLKDEYPEIGLLMKWRKSVKFVQSFGESLLSLINPITGRLHPTFHQLGASSGRMSCTKPNFQQIPSKGDGKVIRGCVVAPPGYKLLVADYSAQELRVLADQSGDARMLSFFEDESIDLHSETARVMFGIEGEVSKDQRDAAKTINYGIAYGMSAFALAARLKIDKKRGEELMEAWFSAYPSVRVWLETRAKHTQYHLNSPTVTGWVRRFKRRSAEPVRPGRGADSEAWAEYNAKKREHQQELNRLGRQGKNTPIQGAAAGITKKALAYIVRGCYTSTTSYPKTGKPFKLIAVVHDEIVLEVQEEYAAEVAEYLADCMDKACTDVLTRVHIPRTQVVVSDHWTH